MLRIQITRAATAAAVLFVAASLATPASANLISNGSFETGDFAGWTPLGNSTFDGVSCGGAVPVDDGVCAGFFGPIGTTGGISQALATVAGGTYRVEFSFQSETSFPSSFQALFGGSTLVSLANPPSAPYTRYSFDVTADGPSSSLEFLFRNDAAFSYLDRVSVTQAGSAAPEPAAWAMMLLGFGALGGMVRRARRSWVAEPGSR